MLSLDMRKAESNVVAMASPWWVLKAVEDGRESYAQRELVVQVGEWRGVERLVREELGLVNGRWQQPGVVSWTREVLDSWRQAEAAAAAQQSQETRLPLDAHTRSAHDPSEVEERPSQHSSTRAQHRR